MEGRVEVCTSYSRWGTVCNKQWTSSYTRVVCRNLGYSDSDGMFFNNIRSLYMLLLYYIRKHHK